MEVFLFNKSDFPGKEEYFFTTYRGTKYEVSFTRKQTNFFCFNMVFGVVNEEFKGEDYCETNRGEIYSVMNTIIAIVNNFIKEHSYVKTLEFVGQPKEESPNTNQRNKLYVRYIEREGFTYFFDEQHQKIVIQVKN